MDATAILLVAHGTPETIDQIPAFLDNIRRGRPTPNQVVAEVQHRYAAIGGRSPLLGTTRDQARLLGDRLGLPCLVAMRMWHPYIADVLREAVHRGFRRLIALVMAPHSAFVYERVLQEAAAQLASDGASVPQLAVAPCIGSEPRLVEAFATLVRERLDAMDVQRRMRTVLVPSAHSLPLRVVQAGDPYPGLVEQTANAVIEKLGPDAVPSILAFQSQGMTADPWLGPDLPTVFDRARATGATGVLVVPVGFLADHVETLYDLDIEARALAEERGLGFDRTRCPGTHPLLIDALEAVARRLL